MQLSTTFVAAAIGFFVCVSSSEQAVITVKLARNPSEAPPLAHFSTNEGATFQKRSPLGRTIQNGEVSRSALVAKQTEHKSDRNRTQFWKWTHRIDAHDSRRSTKAFNEVEKYELNEGFLSPTRKLDQHRAWQALAEKKANLFHQERYVYDSIINQDKFLAKIKAHSFEGSRNQFYKWSRKLEAHDSPDPKKAFDEVSRLQRHERAHEKLDQQRAWRVLAERKASLLRHPSRQ